MRGNFIRSFAGLLLLGGLVEASPAGVSPEITQIVQSGSEFQPENVFSGFTRDGEILLKRKRDDKYSARIMGGPAEIPDAARVSTPPGILLSFPRGQLTEALMAQIDGEKTASSNVQRASYGWGEVVLYEDPLGIAGERLERLANLSGTLGAELNRPFFMPEAQLTAECARSCEVNWALGHIEAPAKPKAGCKKVRVAIVDTGVDHTHAQLTKRMFRFPDGEYQVDVSGETGVGRDPRRHGTACAGIVGAIPAGTGKVRGVATGVELMSIKVCRSSDGELSTAALLSAIATATEHGAQVVNLSMATEPGNVPDDFTTSIPAALNLAAATGRGTIFVVAAGNHGRGLANLADRVYPACFNLPNVVCVMATKDESDTILGISNFGADFVDLAAPGACIVSTHPAGSTCEDGTSFAAPYVSGALALIWNRKEYRKARWDVVLEALMRDYTTEVAGLQDKCKNGRRLDLSGF